jgi:anti-anti-sigma factor
VDQFGSFESHYFEFRFRESDALVAELMRTTLSDEENIESVGHELLTLIGKYGTRRLVLDMGQVEYLTSSMIGKLIRAHRQLHRLGGRLVLCDVTQTVRDILQTARLSAYFHIADSEDAAVLQFDDLPPVSDEDAQSATPAEEDEPGDDDTMLAD